MIGLRVPLFLFLSCLSALPAGRAAAVGAAPDTVLSPPWARNAVFYHLYVDRFRDGDPRSIVLGQAPWDSGLTDTMVRRGGDLAGVRIGLSYLEDLGVDAVVVDGYWHSIGPLGQDPLSYFSAEPLQGNNKGFHAAVTESHQRGLHALAGCDWFRAGPDCEVPDEYPEFQEWSRALPRRQPAPPGAPGYSPMLDGLANIWVRYNGTDGLFAHLPWPPGDSLCDSAMAAVRLRVRLTATQRFESKLVLEDRPDLLGMSIPLARFFHESAAGCDSCMAAGAASTALELGRLAGEPSGPAGLDRTPLFLDSRRCSQPEPRTLMPELALLARLCLPGRVMLEYGEEAGLWDDGILPGRPRTMPWSPGRVNVLRLERVRRLLKARVEHPALRSGDASFPESGNPDVLVFTRRLGSEVVVAAFNRSAHAREASPALSGLAPGDSPTAILGSDDALRIGPGTASRLDLPPRSAWVGFFKSNQ